jgi:hypothetical protein
MDAGQAFCKGFPSFGDSDEYAEEEEEDRALESQSKTTRDFPGGRSRSRMDSQPVHLLPHTLDEAAKKLEEVRKETFEEVWDRKTARRSYLTSGKKRKVEHQKRNPGTPQLKDFPGLAKREVFREGPKVGDLLSRSPAKQLRLVWRMKAHLKANKDPLISPQQLRIG